MEQGASAPAPAPSPSPPPAPRVPASVLCSATNHTATRCERDTAYVSAAFLALVVIVAAYLCCRRRRQDWRKREEKRKKNLTHHGGNGTLSTSSSFSQGQFYGEYRGYGTPPGTGGRGAAGGGGRGRTESGAWSFGSNLTPGRGYSFDSAESPSGQSISSSVLYGGNV